MVSVLVYRSLPDGSGFEVLADATLDEHGLKVGGRRPDLVEQSRRVYSERLDRFIVFEDDSKEWLRAFAASFRTAQVGAVIQSDTDHPELVAPPDLLESIRATAHA